MKNSGQKNTGQKTRQPEKGLRKVFVDLCKEKLGEKLKCIVLFGSQARGTATKSSDWDFLIIAEGLPEKSPKRQKMFIPIKRKIIEEYGEVTSVVTATREELLNNKLESLTYGILTGYEVLYGEELWDKYLEHLKPIIQEKKPKYVEKDKTWEVKKLI